MLFTSFMDFQNITKSHIQEEKGLREVMDKELIDALYIKVCIFCSSYTKTVVWRGWHACNVPFSH